MSKFKILTILSIVLFYVTGCTFNTGENANNLNKNSADEVLPINAIKNDEEKEPIPSEAYIQYGDYLRPNLTKDDWETIQGMKEIFGYDVLSNHICGEYTCENVEVSYYLEDSLSNLNDNSLVLESVTIGGLEYYIDTYGCTYEINPTKFVAHSFFCNMDLIGSDINELTVYPDL